MFSNTAGSRNTATGMLRSVRYTATTTRPMANKRSIAIRDRHSVFERRGAGVNTAGVSNTAIGYQALHLDTTGDAVAVGDEALSAERRQCNGLWTNESLSTQDSSTGRWKMSP